MEMLNNSLVKVEWLGISEKGAVTWNITQTFGTIILNPSCMNVLQLVDFKGKK